jgi:hypothetical protein
LPQPLQGLLDQIQQLDLVAQMLLTDPDRRR